MSNNAKLESPAQSFKMSVAKSITEELNYCHKARIINCNVKLCSITIALSKNKGKVQVKLVNFDLALINSFWSRLVLIDAKEKLDPNYTTPKAQKDSCTTLASSDVFSLGLETYNIFIEMNLT